ncbi:MAG TPA: PilN domain-containing protein [Solirubrobacterales bacterium]|jgi:Tfp pilus assembly protein PilN|nr:PilN domain-containing protein [Solirubrobacterales bacterium]
MRPIDLTPSEMRQGARAPMRTGPIPYILIGALVAILAGVALLVMTGNQVSEREGEVAQLKREDAAARQEARRLTPYVQFQTLHEERLTTISSLANSRFDWERVVRELSLVLPADVWLTELTASASGEDEGGGGGSLRGSIAGPAMELEGCAVGQESVARFVTVLKDIDGVTRVAVASSELPTKEEGEASSEGGESEGGNECRTRKYIAKFSIVVAFDAAPIPVTAEGEGEAPATATENAETTSTETESTEGEEG